MKGDGSISENIFDNTYCKYDYIDIHQSQICGVISGTIIFSTHNLATRNIFTIAQKKKAIQQEQPDTHYQFDKKVYRLISGDIPLIRTVISELSGINKYSTGHMLRVMVSFSGGLDQEDSIVFRK